MNEIKDKSLIFVERIKREVCMIGRLYKGDIVIDGSDFWVVDRVEEEPNSFVSAIGVDGGGFINVPFNSTCEIVRRSSLFY